MTSGATRCSILAQVSCPHYGCICKLHALLPWECSYLRALASSDDLVCYFTALCAVL